MAPTDLPSACSWGGRGRPRGVLYRDFPRLTCEGPVGAEPGRRPGEAVTAAPGEPVELPPRRRQGTGVPQRVRIASAGSGGRTAELPGEVGSRRGGVYAGIQMDGVCGTPDRRGFGAQGICNMSGHYRIPSFCTQMWGIPARERTVTVWGIRLPPVRLRKAYEWCCWRVKQTLHGVKILWFRGSVVNGARFSVNSARFRPVWPTGRKALGNSG